MYSEFRKLIGELMERNSRRLNRLKEVIEKASRDINPL